MFELVLNRHREMRINPGMKRRYQRSNSENKLLKLSDLKRNKVDIEALVQETLEYFEKHGGLMAYVTIKKMNPRYESCMFS
jgi:hypothetical protein